MVPICLYLYGLFEILYKAHLMTSYDHSPNGSHPMDGMTLYEALRASIRPDRYSGRPSYRVIGYR